MEPEPISVQNSNAICSSDFLPLRDTVVHPPSGEPTSDATSLSSTSHIASNGACDEHTSSDAASVSRQENRDPSAARSARADVAAALDAASDPLPLYSPCESNI